MSLKPEVARVRGVHSVTNPSQEGDIGFPQLQLEKLFEAATVKELAQGEPYNDKKKYAYLNPNWPADPNKYLSIENEAHFYCVRDGYCGLDGSVDHYYTKEGDDYKYNAVPPTGSWEGKFALSEAIKNKELYSISQEEERIYVDGGYYIKKENRGYEKQGRINYTTFEAEEFNWNDNKYKCKTSIVKDPETGAPVTDEDGIIVTIDTWQDNNNELAKNGYYIYVHKKSTADSTLIYKVKLLYIEFNDGIWKTDLASLYKLPEGFSTADLYVKNGQKIVELSENEITLDNDPAADNSIYYKTDSWLYPSTSPLFRIPDLLADPDSKWHLYSDWEYPIFMETMAKKIAKVSNDPHTVYEKLAVTVNYKYSGNNNLKFIFTDKSVDEVLDVCGLNNPDISKYVHLTNLAYSKNS